MIPERVADTDVAAQRLIMITSSTRTSEAGLVPRCNSVIAAVITIVRPTATATRVAV
jgi:hypothetical protein